MTAPRSPSDELRELHESYTWEVNAAVGRGEDAVAVRLTQEYADRALRLITERLGHAS